MGFTTVTPPLSFPSSSSASVLLSLVMLLDILAVSYISRMALTQLLLSPLELAYLIHLLQRLLQLRMRLLMPQLATSLAQMLSMSSLALVLHGLWLLSTGKPRGKHSKCLLAAWDSL